MSNPELNAKEGLRKQSVSRFNRELDTVLISSEPNPSGGALPRCDALTRPARCRSDLQAEELLEEVAQHVAVTRETKSSDSHRASNGKSRNPQTAVCSETLDCPCSRSRHTQQEPHCPGCTTRVMVMLRALPPLFIQETHAAQRALCDLVKGSFTPIHLCARHLLRSK